MTKRLGHIISMLQIRGGTGKTTTAGILAGTLARRGMKVLVIDMDNNTAFTSDLGFCVQDRSKSFADAFKRFVADKPVHLQDLILKAPHVENLDFIPQYEGFKDEEITAVMELQKAMDPGLQALGGNAWETHKRSFLGRMLEPIRHDYDYIILDTVSKEDAILTRNALSAAHYVLISMKPSYSDVPKALSCLTYYEQAVSLGNEDLALLGIHITWARGNRQQKENLITDIRGIFPEPLQPLLLQTAMRDCGKFIEDCRIQGILPAMYPREKVVPQSQLTPKWASKNGRRRIVGKRYTDAQGKKHDVDESWIGIGTNKEADGSLSTVLDDMEQLTDEVLERMDSSWFFDLEDDWVSFIEQFYNERHRFLPQPVVNLVTNNGVEQVENPPIAEVFKHKVVV